MPPQILAMAGHVALYTFDTETKAWVRANPLDAVCRMKCNFWLVAVRWH